MKPVAFVFPGQGSQSVGMLAPWSQSRAVRETLEQASEALGEDVAALIAQGPKEALDLTTNTQPVMLAADVAIWRAWLEAGGPKPVALAGHSLGEYAALVACGALTLEAALPLVRLRAQAMQEAVPVGQGAMAAIMGLAGEKVVATLAQLKPSLGCGQVVEAVNFNDPLQTVIAGDKAAVEQATVALKGAGARRALPLPVSAPFHSSLMRPAAEKLLLALGDVVISPPQIPLVNNVDVAVCSEPGDIRQALYRQAFSPVRWVECTLRLEALGAAAIIECGPGKALTGMGRRICPTLACESLSDPDSLAQVLKLLEGR